MSIHFTLSDIDPEAPSKKEVIRIDGSNFQFPQPYSGSKKRRVDEVYDLDDPAANLLTAVDMMLETYIKKVETIDDMRKLAIDRIAAHEKDSVKLAKAKRKIKTLKAKLSKKSNEVNDEAMAKSNILIDEAKRDATIAVLETRILMAREAAENGFDISIWDIQTWKDKLVDIKGNDLGIEMTPTSTSNRAFKAPKRESAKAPKPSLNKALMSLEDEMLDSGDKEDATMGGGTDDGDNSSGEDGI